MQDLVAACETRFVSSVRDLVGIDRMPTTRLDAARVTGIRHGAGEQLPVPGCRREELAGETQILGLPCRMLNAGLANSI